jgi:hypothetical protein
MTPQQLAARIRKLPETAPITTEFERVLTKRGIWSRNGVWYTTQKEHWLGWLSEYSGPGYYGRKSSRRSAELVYNHIVRPPMVLWLGEASGVPRAIVATAKQSALSSSPNFQAQSAAIRKIIPWDLIDNRLNRQTGGKTHDYGEHRRHPSKRL